METNAVPDRINAPEKIDTELAEAIRELRGLEKKNLRINRIRLCIALACLAVCAVLAVVVFRNLGKLIGKADVAVGVLTDAGNNVNTLAKDIEKMDIERLGQSLNNIVAVSEETIGEIHQAAGGLDTLVRDADDAMQHINSVDFEGLNNGIQRLNDILKPVSEFFKILK